MSAQSRLGPLAVGTLTWPTLLCFLLVAGALLAYNGGQRANDDLGSSLSFPVLMLFFAAGTLYSLAALAAAVTQARVVNALGNRPDPMRALNGSLALWCIVTGAGFGVFWGLLMGETELVAIALIVPPLAVFTFGLDRFMHYARARRVPAPAARTA